MDSKATIPVEGKRLLLYKTVTRHGDGRKINYFDALRCTPNLGSWRQLSHTYARTYKYELYFIYLSKMVLRNAFLLCNSINNKSIIKRVLGLWIEILALL